MILCGAWVLGPGARPCVAEEAQDTLLERDRDRDEPGYADESLPCFPRRALWRPVVTGRADLETDLAGDRGAVAILRGILDLEGAVPVTPRLALGLSTGFQGSSYDFSDPEAIVAGEGRLMEQGNEFRFVPGVAWAPNDAWRVLATAYVGSGWVPGADPSEGMSYGGTFAVRRSIRGPFGLRGFTVGASYRTAIEDDGYWFPILSFDGGGGEGSRVRVVTRGPGIGVAYGFTERLAVGISARYDRHDFRLADDDRVSGGVFRDLHIPVGIDVDWRATKRLTLTASAAVNVYSEYRFDDAQGRKVDDFEGDPGVTLGLVLTLLF